MTTRSRFGGMFGHITYFGNRRVLTGLRGPWDRVAWNDDRCVRCGRCKRVVVFETRSIFMSRLSVVIRVE